jgi:hypothetical protein
MKNLVKLVAVFILVSILAACHLPSWYTYANTTYHFQLQFPPGGAVVTNTPTAARIQLPIVAGTNLAEKYLDISVATGVFPCLSPEAAGYEPGSLTPVHLTINGLDWTKVSGGEGAAGSYYQWTGYSTGSGDICVSLTFVLHSHPPGVYSTPPPTFDEPAESAVFGLIVDTFTWLVGPLPTLVVTYTPTPVVSFTPTPAIFIPPTLVPTTTFTPTGLGLFFIPHLNAYCRLGPDPIFDSIDVAMKGQSYPIDGRDTGNAWFRIMLGPNRYCWVLQSTGSASGDLSKLRVLFSPPTPTFTPVPVDCSQYKDPKSCIAVQACKWQSVVGATGAGKCVNK